MKITANGLVEEEAVTEIDDYTGALPQVDFYENRIARGKTLTSLRGVEGYLKVVEGELPPEEY